LLLNAGLQGLEPDFVWQGLTLDKMSPMLLVQLKEQFAGKQVYKTDSTTSPVEQHEQLMAGVTAAINNYFNEYSGQVEEKTPPEKITVIPKLDFSGFKKNKVFTGGLDASGSMSMYPEKEMPSGLDELFLQKPLSFPLSNKELSGKKIDEIYSPYYGKTAEHLMHLLGAYFPNISDAQSAIAHAQSGIDSFLKLTEDGLYKIKKDEKFKKYN
jgi:hypothetical protein